MTFDVKLFWNLYYIFHFFFYSNVGCPLSDTFFRFWSWWSLHELAILNDHLHRPRDWIFLISCMQVYNLLSWLVQLVGLSVMLFGVGGQFLHNCPCWNIRLAFLSLLLPTCTQHRKSSISPCCLNINYILWKLSGW